MIPQITFFSASRADFAALSAVLRSAGERLSARLILSSDAEAWPAEAARNGVDCPTVVAGFSALSDTGRGAAARIAQLTEFLATELTDHAPDCVVAAGDRYELLGLLGAAVPLRIPLAHISGGEVTEGAFDEQIRHAVTKASHLHFVGHQQFADRVHRMGEESWRIHVTGDPGLDAVHRLDPEAVGEAQSRFGFTVDRQLVLVAYHPVTLEPEQTWREWEAIEMALHAHPGAVVVTAGNADPQGLELRRRQEAWCQAQPRRHFVTHLGQRYFLAILAAGGCLVGNSSAGIWEAPSVGAPAVNLGRRQEGRLRGANVLDVPQVDGERLPAALARALDPAFRAALAGVPNPYGDGRSGLRIAEVLAALPPRARLLNKRFADLEA